jgi:hypothetical protein
LLGTDPQIAEAGHVGWRRRDDQLAANLVGNAMLVAIIPRRARALAAQHRLEAAGA